MAKKLFELVRPKSLTDPAYADYEYLIRWIGNDGSDYLYMFYDAEMENKIQGETINIQDVSNIETLISNEFRNINLTADDLSLNDLLILAQIFKNKYVTRILQNDTVERYAPDTNSFKYRLMQGRYKVEFTLIMANATSWK